MTEASRLRALRRRLEAKAANADDETSFTDALLDDQAVTLTPRELLEMVAKLLADMPDAKREQELRRQTEAQCERMRAEWLAAERRCEKLVKLIEADRADDEMTSEMLEEEITSLRSDCSELVDALAETVSVLDEVEDGWNNYQIKKLLRRWQDRIRQEGRTK